MRTLTERLEAVRDWTVGVRRHLHAIPEVAFQEEKTAAYVAETLRGLGYAPETGVGGTGVAAVLDTGRPGPSVMFRADMDALPMQEESGLAFASTHAGAAHCCGHDCHTAMLLGAAKVLAEIKDSLSGTILLVFQPAEEVAGGAQAMLDQGLFEKHPVDWCFGQHLWPALPLGTVGVKPGNLMAAMSWFEVRIIGKGGHGAMPHLCVDALEVGTQVVAALQRITSRQSNPLQPTVVTVGKFHAGTALNIISGQAELGGTTRTFDTAVWKSWEQTLTTVVKGVCDAMGAGFELDFRPGCPPVINHAKAAAMARAAAVAVMGEDKVVEPEPTMGGEDFALYQERTKGAFTFIGAGVEGGFPLHNPKIVFPEEALAHGVALTCQTAWDLLA